MDTRMVTIKNTSGGYCGYIIANKNVRRELTPKMELRVSYEEIQEGLFDIGIRRMFTEGLLSFKDKKDAVDLGLLEEEIPVVTDDVELLNVLKSGHSGNIYKIIKDATLAERDRIIATIVQHKILNEAVIKWAEELLHFNVLTAVKNIRDAESAPDTIDE